MFFYNEFNKIHKEHFLSNMRQNNLNSDVVRDFGQEWQAFDQSGLDQAEIEAQFDRYFRIFPWGKVDRESIGADIGCGSGRWAKQVAPRVHTLHCIDASSEAISVARKNLENRENCNILQGSVDNLPLDDDSLDFAYSLGVLHHIPDTTAGLASCVAKLKSGAPFLVYLYYAFDNRSRWFKYLWKVSDLLRRIISTLPFRLKIFVTGVIATIIYYPLAWISLLLEKAGMNVDTLPLSAYRKASFYTMRTDALDRFGTRLERRFTREDIKRMMESAGLTDIRFSDAQPYWCAVGFKEKNVD
ncbi:MAG: class I SAM-dependent methyltransferase [Gammaproteobacteria bacterium]